jgi:serine/threonine protein kinase
MWSLGVIIFVIVTGRIPWEDIRNQTDLFYDIQVAKFHVPGNLSVNLANLINGLMNPQPLLRFTIEQAVRHPWLWEMLLPLVRGTSLPSQRAYVANGKLPATGKTGWQGMSARKEVGNSLMRPRLRQTGRTVLQSQRTPTE